MLSDEALPPELAALPYRLGVGIVVLNADRQVWIGRRCQDFVTDEIVNRWQMPQGGIDGDEDPRQAALRELWEETGIRSVELLAETDWLSYDLPREAVGRALKGKYRGQRQKWFAVLFTGDEREIDLQCQASHKPEFDAWRWASSDEVVSLIVSFKRPIYVEVMRAFAPFFTPRDA